jgi:hypothetical protein
LPRLEGEKCESLSAPSIDMMTVACKLGNHVRALGPHLSIFTPVDIESTLGNAIDIKFTRQVSQAVKSNVRAKEAARRPRK